MGLKISLKPHEKIIVNGAVVANGERPAHLLFMNNASFLREKDIMIEEGIQTDHDLFYFLIQLIYIDPEQAARYLVQLETAADVIKKDDPENADEISRVLVMAQGGDCYTAMRAWKKLFPDVTPGRKRAELEPEAAVNEDHTTESAGV